MNMWRWMDVERRNNRRCFTFVSCSMLAVFFSSFFVSFAYPYYPLATFIVYPFLSLSVL